MYVAYVKIFKKISTCEVCDLKERRHYIIRKRKCVLRHIYWRKYYIIYLKNIYFDINAYTQQTYVQVLFTTDDYIQHKNKYSITYSSLFS